MYRLHIDIPVGHDKDLAKSILDEVLARLSGKYGVGNELERTANYRLGHDEDRQKSNHLHVNENGHVGHKKDTLEI